jgi:hypothetical protein
MGSTAYLQERLFSIPDFSRNSVARSLVFCVVFYRPLFVPLGLFSFGHCIVCPPIDGFRLSLCFLKIVPQVYHKSRISDRRSPLDGGLSGYNTESMVMDHSW